MQSKHAPHLAALLTLICCAGAFRAEDAMAQSPGHGKSVERIDDSMGNLHVPARYRESYEFLGTWAIAAEKAAGSQQLHVVYASSGSIAAYRRSGQFPDGTVLVKEVYAATTATMTTGTVSREQELKGWFVMLKDSSGVHPRNPLWGDGWAWSWFDADKPTKTTSTDYKKDCLPCHVPAKSTDWIYIQGYPPLAR